MTEKHQDEEMDQIGKCLCGAVEFQVLGEMAFSALCHCRGGVGIASACDCC